MNVYKIEYEYVWENIPPSYIPEGVKVKSPVKSTHHIIAETFEDALECCKKRGVVRSVIEVTADVETYVSDKAKCDMDKVMFDRVTDSMAERIFIGPNAGNKKEEDES